MKNHYFKLQSLYKQLFLFMLLSLISVARAQYVLIPDTNFALYIKTTYPSCMLGSNKLDTSCTAIRNAKSMNLNFKNISNLEGIQYFHSLIELTCAANKISNVSLLPENLKKFSCQDNYMQSIAMLPSKLEYLFCQDNGLRTLPALPETLTYLNIHGNFISQLPTLPNGLKFLYGEGGKLDSLPILPDSLEELSYAYCGIKTLPKLPPNLKLLDISKNQINSIPNVPPGLKFLIVNNCGLTQLPILPSTLKILICHNNKLTELPALPPNLITLQCANNQIRCIPALPVTLKDTNDVILGRWGWLEMKGISMENNLFTCLPNYVSIMDSTLLSYPICTEGDTLHNKSGCRAAEGVKGVVFIDNNLNCEFDLGEKLMKNFVINLRDANNKLLARQMTFGNGAYYFLCPIGNYNIDIDTSELPVVINCNGGTKFKLDHNYFGQQSKDINFALSCGNADLGVKSVLTQGIIFPGRNHVLRILVGDMSQWYGLNCASGYGGKVIVGVTGKVQYISPALDSKYPSKVNGNIFTYQVPDFGEMNIFKDFGINFHVDTSATFIDSIIVDVEIIPDSIDKNRKNNHLKFSYRIGNSFDPNFKEVYPAEVPPNYDGWLTYTVHFQNTGTAKAFDIKVIDTLDTKLSTESFEVLHYSHPMRTELKGHTVSFIFDHIMLPDSNSNYDSSCGFVQYRVRPSSSYPNGTSIPNKASIYFDYNQAVITNTSICEFVENTNSVSNFTYVSKPTIFPNPSSGKIQINTVHPFFLSIKDFYGREVMKVSDTTELELQKGIYFFQFIIDNTIITEKVVVL